ncbi:MAG: DinB family protein, partial [Gemmatimonadaceae bacterium]
MSPKATPGPQLVDIERQLEAASNQARSVVAGLSTGQLIERPEPHSWSVAECLVHLTITAESYFPILLAELNRADWVTAVTGKTYKMDRVGRLMRWMLEPPARIKVKTPAKFQPLNVDEPDEVLARFLDSQARMKECVARSEGLPLDEVKVNSPFSSRMSYNLLSCFN